MRVFIASVALAGSVFAAGGPENVLLLVNGDSWASTAIANEYRALRDLAPDHLIVLRDLPSFERVGVADFREKILLPGLQEAERRGLGGQLDYVLYSADFPTAIDVSEDMAGKTFPKQITQPASITGLTFLYKFSLAKHPSYLGLNSNFYFRQISRAMPGGVLPEATQARYAAALKRLEEVSRRNEEARKAENSKATLSAEDTQGLREIQATLSELKTAHPGQTEILYNLACVQARLGEDDAAIATLRAAMEKGWYDLRHAQQDSDLRSIRDLPGFKELVSRARDADFELWPTSGFRGNVGWLPTGQPVPPNQGVRYLLSTTLAHTSGRGNSVAEAISGLTRSAKADATRPAGTVYYLKNGDVRSTTREWGFSRSVAKLERLGLTSKIEEGILPAKKPDVAGLTVGAADFSWPQSGSTIVPGAICDHLTSFGGMLQEGDSQTPLTEFLRYGAAGASGTVTEPFAIQAKFPTPFVHYHYAQGCTLAEAFYQSVAGPYQLLIVGDALCAPWKKRISVQVPDFATGTTVRGKVSIRPTASSPDNIAISHFELFVSGRRVAVAKAGLSLEFDSSTIADGAHEFQIVANGTDPLASTGRLVVPCNVRNGAGELEIQQLPSELPWDSELKLSARAPGAKSIVVRSAGTELARLDASEGTLQLDPRRLGSGPVQLQPVAILENGREHYGEPLRFRVIAPKALPAQALPAGKKLVNGFHVSRGGEAPVVVGKAENDWLTKAGVKSDEDFVIESWLTVDRDETYQFQFRGPGRLHLTVDGVKQEWPRGKEWWFVPVNLAKGLHRVRIEGKAEGTPTLEARFGGPGSYRLAGERFQHLE